MTKSPGKHPFALLNTAYNTLVKHPEALFPLVLLAFLQFFLLEILFFAPREPLSHFFGQIIARTEGEVFMHYPFNFALIARWFQRLQIPFFIALGGYFLGCTVAVVNAINSGKTVKMKSIFKNTLSRYLHLLVAVLVMVGLIQLMSMGYDLMIKRANQIRSTSGTYFMIKQAVLVGAPYFHLLMSVTVTTLFAFVIPLIVIDRKSVFPAFVENFKLLWGSFWFMFFALLLPAILYLPVILLKSNKTLYGTEIFPEMTLILIVGGIVATVLIEALQYTAITSYYLLKKENS